MPNVKSLVNRLRLMSGLRAMGDRCAFGEDAALFEEAANTLERLRDEIALAPRPFCIAHSDFPYEECPWCEVDELEKRITVGTQ